MFYVENILSVPFLWKTIYVIAKCVIEFSLKLQSGAKTQPRQLLNF